MKTLIISSLLSLFLLFSVNNNVNAYDGQELAVAWLCKDKDVIMNIVEADKESLEASSRMMQMHSQMGNCASIPSGIMMTVTGEAVYEYDDANGDPTSVVEGTISVPGRSMTVYTLVYSHVLERPGQEVLYQEMEDAADRAEEALNG